MFLQLEHGESIDINEIIGIFDIETSTLGADTRALLARKESETGVISLSNDLPKSFLLCDNAFGDRVYVSGLSGESVVKRCGMLVRSREAREFNEE